MSAPSLQDQVDELAVRVERLEKALREAQPLAAPDTDERGPYQTHSATSKAAAYANLPRSGTQRARILDFLATRADRGATRQEIAAALDMSDDSVRPRVVELSLGGWVKATERTRATPLGEQAEVLVITERALLEREAEVESVRSGVSPAPVVSEEPGPTALGHALLGQQGPGSSETAALFDLPARQPEFDEVVTGPRNAIFGDDAA